jgi:hypothetical protein
VSVCSGHGRGPQFVGQVTWLTGDSQAVIKIAMKIKADIIKKSPGTKVETIFWTSKPNAGIIWDEHGRRRHSPQYPSIEKLWAQWEHLIDDCALKIDCKYADKPENAEKIERWWATTPSIVRQVLADNRQRVPAARRGKVAVNPNKVTRWARKKVEQAGGGQKLIGYFLIGEGAISIVASQDQRGASTLGRVARILAGLWLVRRKR